MLCFEARYFVSASGVILLEFNLFLEANFWWVVELVDISLEKKRELKMMMQGIIIKFIVSILACDKYAMWLCEC